MKYKILQDDTNKRTQAHNTDLSQKLACLLQAWATARNEDGRIQYKAFFEFSSI